ncbi:hypothetical protein [Carnobacterium sp.]|uniref:hypothetical protein n=1 Tax=Carnobacterium sp. TaxID=48221 RepID=UPI00388F7481
MNSENTWIYSKISNEFYKEHRKHHSFMKSLKFYWNQNKLNFILFLVWIILIITCGILQTIYSFDFVQVASAVIFLFIYYSTLLVSISREKSKNLHDVDDSKLFVKMESILKKYNITVNDYERLLLESEKEIYKSSEKYNKSLSHLYKLSTLLLIAPIGFLLSFGITLEGNAITSDLDKYINNISSLIPLTIVFGCVIILSLIMLGTIIYSDAFMNFIFYERQVAVVMKRYLGTLCYEKTVIHDTLPSRVKILK